MDAVVAVLVDVVVLSPAAAAEDEKVEVEKLHAVMEPTEMKLLVFWVAGAWEGEGEEGDGDGEALAVLSCRGVGEGVLVGGACEDGEDRIGVRGMRIVDGEVARVETRAEEPEGTAFDAHDEASAGIAVLVHVDDEDDAQLLLMPVLEERVTEVNGYDDKGRVVIFEPLLTAIGGVNPRLEDLSVQDAVDVAVTVVVEAVGTTFMDERLPVVEGLVDALPVPEEDDALEVMDAMLAVEARRELPEEAY